MHSQTSYPKKLPHPSHPRHPLNQLRAQATPLKASQKSPSIDILRKASLWLLTQKGPCNKASLQSPVYRQPSIMQGLSEQSPATASPIIMQHNTPIASQTNYLSITLPSLLKHDSLPLRQATNQLILQRPKSIVSGGFRPFKRQNTIQPLTQISP